MKESAKDAIWFNITLLATIVVFYFALIGIAYQVPKILTDWALSTNPFLSNPVVSLTFEAGIILCIVQTLHAVQFRRIHSEAAG
jgi:hypothetical protein